MSSLNDSSATKTVIAEAGTTKARKQERGEGVISTAIAVLIVVALGGLMWTAYKATFDTANKSVGEKVTEIGK